MHMHIAYSILQYLLQCISLSKFKIFLMIYYFHLLSGIGCPLPSTPEDNQLLEAEVIIYSLFLVTEK